MKKMISLLLALMLVGSFASFAEGMSFGASFHSTYHEFFADMIDGMKDTAVANGVALTIVDENGDAGTQYNTMENFIQQKLDGII